MYKVMHFWHPWKSHAQNGRSDSTPSRILTSLQVLQIGVDPVLGCRRLNAQSLVVPSELTTSELELDELLQRWACVSDLFRSENRHNLTQF
jgi:hypothetical protein